MLCCFNRGYKLNPEVFDAWMRILAEVPDAVLWLLARPGEEMLERNLRREMVRRGLDARRLQFTRARANPDYLALYRVADLFLDTWPYNAHTTASDALWAGCPVVTLRGETFAARVAASLLTAVGLPELIATTSTAMCARRWRSRATRTSGSACGRSSTPPGTTARCSTPSRRPARSRRRMAQWRPNTATATRAPIDIDVARAA